MIFPAPIFLYLLPLAGLPIVFHLILKQKKRTVVFSTLMFFYRTNPKLNSHRKIRQWLLLLMRVLLIALILLALSRPKFVTSTGLGGKISVVAIIDNSGSMSSTSYDSSKTKLECAVEGARSLISTLPEGSEAAVVLLVNDPVVEVANSLTSDTESVLTCLDRIRATQATGNARLALTRAFRLLRTSSAGSGAIHVFSDLQRSEWAKAAQWPEASSSSPAAAGTGLSPQKWETTVYFHKINSEIRNEANVAITAIQFPQEKVLPKHPYRVGLVLQNNSGLSANIRVNSIDSKGRKNTKMVTLQQSRTKVVQLQMKPDEAGYHWIQSWIEGDGFSADNEAAIGILCQETATVLFGGKPEEFGVLPVALSPSGQGQFTGLTVQFCPTQQLNEARQWRTAEKPILVVTTWSGLQLTRENSVWLAEYVENGGNLLIVPSLTQRTFSGQTPDWLGVDTKTREAHARGVNLEVLDKNATFWQEIRQATVSSPLESVSAYVFHSLELSAEFTPLLGVDPPRRVVIAHRKLGKGNIYVSGTAFGSHWNTLPLTGLLVVMAQRMAIAGTSSGEESAFGRSLVAGESPISGGGTKTQSGEVEILSLVGDPMDWKGKESEMPAFPKAGVYLVKTGNPPKTDCISVRASEKEGLEEFIEGSQVPAMGQIAHKILPYDEVQDFQRYHAGQARAVELYLPLLLLATLALLAEGWLGAPRPAQDRYRTSYLVKRISCFASRLGRAG